MQGGGCFWCLEACYQQLKGVSKVVSGYAGGHVDNPTYQQVGRKNIGLSSRTSLPARGQNPSSSKGLEPLLQGGGVLAGFYLPEVPCGNTPLLGAVSLVLRPFVLDTLGHSACGW
jgi:hypothetical protein